MHVEMKFQLEKTTPGTYKYSADHNGRNMAFYIPKDLVEGEAPQEIVVTATDA